MERIIVCQTPKDDNNSKTLVELRKKLPPCPICGRKAYLSHDVVDGADYGYSAGCPAFRLNDGIHGMTEQSDKKMFPIMYCYTARQAFNKWVKYCERYKGKTNE